MNTVEDLIRLSIDFESRTAFPVSEYDGRPLALLNSAAKLCCAKRHNETDISVSEEAYTLLERMNSHLESYPDVDTFELIKQCINIAKELSYGSRMDSRLEQYGYDMVFAATLGSINTVIKEYLDKAAKDISVQTKYYIETVESGKVMCKEASSEIAEQLEALDLFSIPDDPEKRTDQQQAALNEAYGKLMLSFGFRAAIGLPTQADVENIIDFDTGETGNHTKVRYNMYFKEFSIIQFSTSRSGSFVYNQFSQTDSPWVFQYTVDLGMVGVSQDVLPSDIKEKINNIDPEQIFSISQLFLDLNTTALINSPSITGVNPETDYYLNTYFLEYYFKQMKEKSGDVILGYSITPQSISSNKPYLLRPTDFRFYVSPYFENGKAVPEKKKLYTLNYIVICDNKPFPELREINWNWIEEKDYTYINGAMAINKSRIYDFTKQEYTNLLKNLLFDVIAEINVSFTSISFRLGITQDQSTDPTFDDQTYHYSRSAKDSDTFVPVWGNVEMKYDMTAKLKNYQTDENNSVLECRVDTVVWMHVNVEGGVSEGNTYNKTNYYTLTINIDEYGKLTLTPDVKETDNGTTFDTSGWSTFLISGLEDYLKQVKQNIDNYLTQNKDYWNNQFINRYNNNATWYLPGDGNLIFKQHSFSCDCDLTFDANYATPTNEVIDSDKLLK